jgi:hypothetical protein
VRLPVPFRPADRTFYEAEVTRFKGGALADARRAADDGNPYQAMLLLAAAGTASLSSLEGYRAEDRAEVKELLEQSPYVNVEYLAVMSLVKVGAGAPVDMLLKCPLCKAERIDRSPSLDELEVSRSELEGDPVVPEPAVKLKYPVSVTGKSVRDGDTVTLMSASELAFVYPTLSAVSGAMKRVGMVDQSRFQFFAWGRSITHVDGEAVDDKWRLQWWDKLFERMDPEDIREVSKALTEFGLRPSVEVTCMKCGHRWTQEVPTGDFFGSGLQGA